MKNRMMGSYLALLVAGFASAGCASAATQTISASVNNGNATYGTASTFTFSTVKCVSASGGSGTLAPSCGVTGPGTFGTNGSAPLRVGETVSTTGPGTITLGCYGSSSNGHPLSCSATVDDTVCAASKTITATSYGGDSYKGSAGTVKPVTVKCVSASGSSTGTTKCGIRGQGTNGNNSYATVAVGQSVSTTAAGDISLGCSGSYSASGGRLNCSALITQVCP